MIKKISFAFLAKNIWMHLTNNWLEKLMAMVKVDVRTTSLRLPLHTDAIKSFADHNLWNGTCSSRNLLHLTACCLPFAMWYYTYTTSVRPSTISSLSFVAAGVSKIKS